MELFTNFPVIPVVTFVLIAGFFGYQLKLYLKERKKAATPSVPNLGNAPLKDNSAQFVNKVAAASVAKPAIHKKLQPFNKILGGAVIALLLVSSIGFFYVFQQGEKLSFVPRANIEPTSPLLVSDAPTPTTPIDSSITDVPIVTSITPTEPIVSETIALSPTVEVSITPELEPTATKVPEESLTPTETLLAYYNTNVYPTNTPTPEETATPTPKKSEATATPKPKKEIPQAGVSLGSVLLIAGSAILLTLGFAL